MRPRVGPWLGAVVDASRQTRHSARVLRSCLALALGLALPAAGCEEWCAAGCPGTGIIRVHTANGEVLEADEVVVELHVENITCRVAIDEGRGPEPCEADVGVARGIAQVCSSTEDECRSDLTSSIEIYVGGEPAGPVTVSLLRNGETIAAKKFGRQPPMVDCGTCPRFEHDWRLDA